MSLPSSYLTILNEWEITRGLVMAQMNDYAMEKDSYDISLHKTLPSLYDIKDFIFIGSFSWVCKAKRYKYLLERHATLNMCGWQTPAEIARDYIMVKYGKTGRITSNQYEEITRHRQAPIYAKPAIIDRAVYVDLKSAYWSILQVLGWDVDYFPARWLSVKSDVRDFPYWKHKLARNCLVSVGLSGQSKAWDGEKLVFHRKRNPLTNMMLWSAVQDVLNGIASDMVDAGAYYVHTDGYIFDQKNLSAAMQVFSDWGLVGTIRHEGRAEIIGAGTYSIGKKQNNRIARMRPRFHNGIRPVELDWLKKRFSIFSHGIDIVLG